MVKTGYAKGANSGHIVQERSLPKKPSSRKGVRTNIHIFYLYYLLMCL
jgi:hypothetical protein